MKFCIPTAITCMALSFCSAAVDVALRGSVDHENDIAELDLATLKHGGKYLHTLDGTSTDANLIAPLVTDLNTGIICASYAIKSVSCNNYIRARPDGEVDTQTYVGSWERFTIQDLGSGLYSIKSVAHGTYLRAQKEGSVVPPGVRKDPIVDLQTYVGSFEKFKLEYEDGGVVSIRSKHGTYVNVYLGGKSSTVTVQAQKGKWVKFELVCLV